MHHGRRYVTKFLAFRSTDNLRQKSLDTPVRKCTPAPPSNVALFLNIILSPGNNIGWGKGGIGYPCPTFLSEIVFFALFELFQLCSVLRSYILAGSVSRSVILQVIQLMKKPSDNILIQTSLYNMSLTSATYR